jgi:hypothetical protein
MERLGASRVRLQVSMCNGIREKRLTLGAEEGAVR